MNNLSLTISIFHKVSKIIGHAHPPSYTMISDNDMNRLAIVRKLYNNIKQVLTYSLIIILSHIISVTVFTMEATTNKQPKASRRSSSE